MADSEQGLKWWLRYIIVPLVGSGGLIAIITFIITSISHPPSTQNAVSPIRRVEQAPTPIAGPPPEVATLKIMEPQEEDKVGQHVEVRGFSPFLRERHYLIITPQNPAQRYVVSGPFVPASDGSWKTTAILGSGLEGLGQWFQIEVLSTQTALIEGPISENPFGSHVSPGVRVFRNK